MRIVNGADPNVYWQAEMSHGFGRWSANTFHRTEEEFCHKLAQKRSIGFEEDGIQFGGCFIDDNDFIHVAVLPSHYGRWGTLYYDMLDWAFSESNTLYALIPRANKKVKQLVTRHRWPVIWEDEFCELYKMTPENTRDRNARTI